MADTQFIKRVIEPFLRHWLERRFTSKLFKEKAVRLEHGSFRFDAVSEDESVVALFMCNRPRTSSGNENSGAVKKALNDIHFLKLLTGPNVVRLAVFTDDGFRDLVMRRSRRIGSGGIEFLHCQLPQGLEQELCENLDACLKEQCSRSDVSQVQSATTPRKKDVLPIDLVPADPNEFRNAVLKSGAARITTSYADGRSETRELKISALWMGGSL